MAEDAFLSDTRCAFQEFILRAEYPCLGARAAFNAGSYALVVYAELACDEATGALSRDLTTFTRSEMRAHEYATFVAVFAGPENEDEKQFEARLWRQLRLLNRIDAKDSAWDPAVRSDSGDPMFSFSFAGQAYYVVGMHPRSSRQARRFRSPTLVFNPHEQFERLRTEGKWKRMQQTIREREMRLQGSINPMLSDFGETSEARQYSGRAVEEDWRAPFDAANPGKCPFGH